jgi:hypothetical protein
VTSTWAHGGPFRKLTLHVLSNLLDGEELALLGWTVLHVDTSKPTTEKDGEDDILHLTSPHHVEPVFMLELCQALLGLMFLLVEWIICGHLRQLLDAINLTFDGFLCWLNDSLHYRCVRFGHRLWELAWSILTVGCLGRMRPGQNALHMATLPLQSLENCLDFVTDIRILVDAILQVFKDLWVHVCGGGRILLSHRAS